MSSAAAVDLFGSSARPAPAGADLPPDVAAGLELLRSSAPLWRVDEPKRWLTVVDSVAAFAERWDGRARACGWTSVQLYGLHRRAPWANLAGMGAAFLIAGDDRPAPILLVLKGPVVAVDEVAIRIVSSAGSKLRIFRCPPDPDSVLDWSLCRPAGVR